MQEKKSLYEVTDIKLYHVVFPTYSRLPLLFKDEYRDFIHGIIQKMDQIKVVHTLSYKILTDHAHLLIKKESHQSLPYLVKLIKGRTTYYFFEAYPDLKTQTVRTRIWAKGYHYTEIKNPIQLNRTIIYIKNNFDKYKDCR